MPSNPSDWWNSPYVGDKGPSALFVLVMIVLISPFPSIDPFALFTRDFPRSMISFPPHPHLVDPAKWMPPLASYQCDYARAWVHAKHFYGLSVDTAEKAALTSYLARC